MSSATILLSLRVKLQGLKKYSLNFRAFSEKKMIELTTVIFSFLNVAIFNGQLKNDRKIYFVWSVYNRNYIFSQRTYLQVQDRIILKALN